MDALESDEFHLQQNLKIIKLINDSIKSNKTRLIEIDEKLNDKLINDYDAEAFKRIRKIFHEDLIRDMEDLENFKRFNLLLRINRN